MDYKEKRKKLESMKNEVNEFHPMLQKLIPKLPNVNHVEYTHGIYEKGADFIIQTSHNILKTEINIGLLVKVGEINKSLTNINEQIEDCQLKRYVFNGKKNVHMDEIWVITNDNITNHAKDKIHEKYNKLSIQFLDGKNVIELIDLYLPNFWYEIPIAIGDYINKFNISNSELDKSLCLINFNERDFYIEQEISKWNKEWKQKKIKNAKSDTVDIYNEINTSTIIYIEGGMGSGKSKLIRKLIDYYSIPENFLHYRYLPISISFKEYLEFDDLNLFDLMKRKISSIPDADLEKDIKYLVFLDALDEVKIDMEKLIDTLSKLIDEVLKLNNVKLIFTSRVINILENNENSIFDKINHLELKSLKPSKVITFIEKICSSAEISKRLYEDLKKSLLFKEIQKSPIGIILLARLLKENNLDLPQNLTELYSKYTELVLGRWDIDKGIQTQKEYEVAEVFIMNLGVYSMENELTWINIDEALHFLQNYLNQRNLGIDSNDLFNKIINRSGILELSQVGDMVRFKHKGFAEFYYAKKQIFNSSNFSIDNKFFTVYWSNVYFFYTGLKRDCPEIISQIVELKPKDEFQRFLKIINVGNIFLAGYQSPYSTFNENLYKIIIEVTEYYFDIRDKIIINYFSGLSELNLLCLIQGIVRHHYSYDFFSKALDHTALAILEDSNLDLNKKVYSLFF